MRYMAFTFVLSIGSLVMAAEEGVRVLPPATQPATRPSESSQISQLIAGLGAESFQDRERAADELRKLGKTALPALKEAAKDPDPEIQARASNLVRELEGTRKSQPTATAREPVFIGPGGMGNVRIEIRAGGVVQRQTVMTSSSRSISVQENGRQVKIQEDDKGLTVSVTEGDKTREYKAKNAEELKKNEPEGYKIYEKYGAKSGVLKLEMNEIKLNVE